MGLLSLTKEGVSFLLDENDIFKVYTLNGITKVDVFKSEANTIDPIIVEESLNDINTLSDELIEVNTSGVAFLINYNYIREIIANGTGSKIIYEGLIKATLKVDETPSEIQALIPNYNPEPEIKSYDALLSQNAPITSTNSGTMLAGQIWELSGAANPADYAFFDTYELVSGTLYVGGSKYRVSVDTAFTFSASAIEYDGSPYIVSTDINGDLNPFVNTLGEVAWSYDSSGSYKGTLIGIYSDKSKLSGQLYVGQNGLLTNTYIIYDGDPDYFLLSTYNRVTAQDDLLNYTPISIEVYP